MQFTFIESIRVVLSFKIQFVSGVANSFKASVFNLFNFKPDYCVIN